MRSDHLATHFLVSIGRFRYATALKNSFLSIDGGISSLKDLDKQGWVLGSSANVFVSNHNTERNNGSLNVFSPFNTYLLATIFSLYGPLVLICSENRS